MTVATTPEHLERMRAWVEALRSGKYEQAVGALRNSDNNYCCLGVLCDISGVGRWTEDAIDNEHRRAYVIEPAYATESEAEFLPREVSQWAGFGTGNPWVYSDDGRDRLELAQLNDSGMSFNEIADLIEQEYLTK